jgi:hypothetical protein
VESLHCSAAYVQRLGFALAKILCPLFGIPTVPGRHILPLWTTIKVPFFPYHLARFKGPEIFLALELGFELSFFNNFEGLNRNE